MAIVNRIRGKVQGESLARNQTQEIGTEKGTEEAQDGEKITGAMRTHRVSNENALTDKKKKH